MAEATRQFEGPGIGRGGIFVVVIVVVLLISLFFIPEIIEFQRSFSKKKDIGQMAASRRSITENVELPASSGEEAPAAIEAPSTLDALSLYLDKKAPETNATNAAKVNERKALAAQEDARASLDSLPTLDAVKPNPKTAGPTWDAIQSGASKEALTKARSAALSLTRSVPEQQSKTRYALINFANGVGLVLEHGTELFSAPAAAQYITTLDQAVGRAMTIENSDRSVMIAWSKIDLGPAIPISIRPTGPANFNPQLNLSWIQLSQNARGMHPDQRALMKVNGGGFVIGNDISAAELVDVHGSLEQFLKLSPPTKKGGYRLFTFSRWANLPLTVQIHDKYGNVYQKSYDFYAAENELPYSPREGRFLLPYRFAYPMVNKFAPWDIDPRVDSRFLIKVWRGTEAQLQVGYNAYSRLADSADGTLFDYFKTLS